MMPDLGKYAGAVMGSYVASILLIGALVGLSIWRGAKVKRALRDMEEKAGRRDA